MKFSKKSQIQSEMLKYILIAVVSFLIIVFSVIVIKNLRDKQREAELIGFKSDLGASVEVIATRINSVDRMQSYISSDIKLVCFLDLDYDEYILDTPLVESYLFIEDSLKSGAKQNMFLILDDDSLKDADYIKDICFKNEPHYYCVKPVESNLDIYLQGLGSCATIFTNYSAYISGNVRNSVTYDQIEFGGILAKDNDDYRDILQIVPLAFVNNKNGTYRQYPFLAYYGDITDTDIGNIMSEKEIDSVIIFIDSSCSSFSVSGKTIICNDLTNYINDFWETIYDVTIIADDNYNGALISALFAAFTNTPLIFIDNANLADYKVMLAEKKVNVIDEDMIDNDVMGYITSNCEVDYFYSNELRILSENRILELESDIIVPELD